ncbi:hypothetical protein QN277_029035 [Acacia crassicarpa]|uniref:Uncharacterized protein n=1 Tax=Acacia crassicarpa TaxID=499986 RepID=A0AAE1MJ28_9FABA|nr:hypothetical protein QN277_029035 [Acacia crassicarpa]
MGNCNACVISEVAEEPSNNNHTNHRKKKKKKTKDKSQNPFADEGFHSPTPIRVLKDVIPLSHPTRLSDKNILGRELGRSEFGITHLCFL